MATIIGRVLATAMLIGLAFLSRRAPISIGQLLLALFGWALAFFGDELSPAIGVHSTPDTAPYVGTVVRGVGWLFLIATFTLVSVRAAHLL
jgi:hypothetical protein